MWLDTNTYLDARFYGGDMRFANHRCAGANCTAQRWRVGYEWRIAIYANRDIKAGEEITWNYAGGVALNKTDPTKTGPQSDIWFHCKCGPEHTRGGRN